MKHVRLPVLVALAMVISGCGLFSGDDGTDLSTAEEFTSPTAAAVQQAPAQVTPVAPAASAVPAAAAALPTAVTIPATAVPPEPTADRSQPSTYVVQSGDVLGLIAERFDVDIAELRRVNDLSGNLIRVGQTLTIPAVGGLTGTEPADATTDESASGTSSGVIGSTTAAAPAATPTPVSCGANAVGHCVQSGDSLLGIASTYGTTVEAVRTANPSIVGDVIRIGDLLTIPGQSSGGSTSAGDTSGGSSIAAPTVPAVVAPLNDADCAARNPEYPYFHAADGLCYANPIGATVVPTASSSTPGTTCPEGTFLWDDGLCYPIPGVTPTVGPTTTPPPNQSPDYGTVPCEEPYFTASASGKCFLTQVGLDAGYGGTGTPTASS